MAHRLSLACLDVGDRCKCSREECYDVKSLIDDQVLVRSGEIGIPVFRYLDS